MRLRPGRRILALTPTRVKNQASLLCALAGGSLRAGGATLARGVVNVGTEPVARGIVGNIPVTCETALLLAAAPPWGGPVAGERERERERCLRFLRALSCTGLDSSTGAGFPSRLPRAGRGA